MESSMVEFNVTVDVEKKPTEVRKKENVPLQEALNVTGVGKYTILLFLTGGLVHFAGDCGIQIMSFIVPAASCDLKLSSYQKGLLTSMGVTGMLTSAHLCGVLGDVYGRRKILLGSLILQAILSLVSSLAPDAQILMFCWFVYGNVAAAVLTLAIVYINEFSPDSVKTQGILVLIAFGGVAEAYLPSVAWLVLPLDISIELFGGLVFKSWRLYLATLSVPCVISIFLLLRLPESPKYVLNEGKMDETLRILQKIYSINNNDKGENFPIANLELDGQDKQLQRNNENGKSFTKFVKSMFTQTAILFSRKFIAYTAIASITLLGIGAMTLTIMFWLPEQVTHVLRYADSHNTSAGICEIIPRYINSREALASEDFCEVNNNMFLISIISGLGQSAAFVVTSILSSRINNKTLSVFLLVTPALLCILILYMRETYWIIGILMLKSIFPNASYPLIMTYVQNYFPTSIRSNATAVIMTIGRIGITGYTVLFGILLESYCDLAYWTLSASLISTALLCIVLPSKRK